MQRANILLLSGLLGALCYLILPTFLKILGFLIPAIAVGYVFGQDSFNWYLFVGISMLYLLFPSSILTLDASNGFNLTATTNLMTNLIQIVYTFVVIILPILMTVAAIWLIVKQGDVEGGLRILMDIFIIICIVGIFTFFAEMFGWSMFGQDSFKKVFQFFWAQIKYVYNWVAKIARNLGIDMPDLVKDWEIINDYSAQTNSGPQIDPGFQNDDPSEFQLLSAIIATPKAFSLTIASIYPLILSCVVFLLGLLYRIFKQNPTGWKTNDEIPLVRPFEFNFQFVIFLVFILTSAFALYLTYNQDTFLNYKTLGFFGIYLIISSVSFIFLSIGIGSPTKATTQTLIGTILGVALLMIFLNMFTQKTTLSAVENEYSVIAVDNIISQFLFVAPTESGLLHVFLPSLVIFYFISKNKVYSKDELEDIILKTQMEINALQNSADIYQNLKKEKLFAETKSILNDKQNELKKLEKQKTTGVFPSRNLTPKQFIIYIIWSLGFNTLFSCLHWFKSGLNFFVFWSCGLGFIYLSSGMIITLIAYRFGWLSGVLAHTIHNSITLFLILIMLV